jgi:4-oxalocrotonate tautomerase
VDAYVSAGTNTPEEKSRFVAEAYALLHKVLGSDLPEVSYVLVHDIPMNSWGYGGRTQEFRAQQA